MPAPGRSIGQPMALAPVTLRPASRGQEPRVDRTEYCRGDLAIDTELDGCWNRALVRHPHGGWRGRGLGHGQAPQSGAPLLLLVPSSQIRAPGHYVLIVADSEYPFEVVAQ